MPDLAPAQYTIEQAKQKSDYDRMVMIAEKNKQEKRVEIAKLRARFKRLLDANHSMPARHRLTRDEFVMDQTLVDDLKEAKMKKVIRVAVLKCFYWECFFIFSLFFFFFFSFLFFLFIFFFFLSFIKFGIQNSIP